LFVSPDKKAVPVTRFIDVGAMLQDMDRLSRKAEKIEKQFSTPFSRQPRLTQLRAGGNGCGGCRRILRAANLHRGTRPAPVLYFSRTFGRSQRQSCFS